MGLTVPFIFLFDALLSKFLRPDALDKVHYEGGTLLYAVPIFSAMHQMSPKKTFLVLLCGPIVVTLLIALLVFGVLTIIKLFTVG
jgi:hypothetical protein